MTKDDTGFLWQNLVRYKRAKERGLAAHILFDDENAFLRFCGSSIALLCKDWKIRSSNYCMGKKITGTDD